jgi:hypothetical protein
MRRRASVSHYHDFEVEVYVEHRNILRHRAVAKHFILFYEFFNDKKTNMYLYPMLLILNCC